MARNDRIRRSSRGSGEDRPVGTSVTTQQVQRTVAPRATPTGRNPAEGLTREAQITGERIEARIREFGADYVRGVDLGARIRARGLQEIKALRDQADETKIRASATVANLESQRMNALTQAFTTFGNMATRAAMTYQDVEGAVAEMEKRKQLDALSMQGQRDAMLKSVDEELLSSSETYSNAVSETRGSLRARLELIPAFQRALASAPMSAQVNPQQFLIDFVQANLANDEAPGGIGTGDVIYDNAMLGALFNYADQALHRRVMSQQSYSRASSREDISELAFAQGREGVTTEDLTYMVGRQSQIDGGGDGTAVLDALATGAIAGGVESGSAFLTAIDEAPLFNGMTMAEARPMAYDQLRQDFHRQADRYRDETALAARSNANELLDTAEGMTGDWASQANTVALAFAEISLAETRYGTPTDRESDRAQRILGQAQEAFTQERLYFSRTVGDRSADLTQQDVDAIQMRVLQQDVGIDMATAMPDTVVSLPTGEAPAFQVAATHLVNVGMVASDVRDTMSSRITNFTDETDVMSGFDFYRRLHEADRAPGKPVFNSAITSDGRDVFDALMIATNEGRNVNTNVLERAARIAEIDMSQHTLAHVYGVQDTARPAQEAAQRFTRDLNKTVGQRFNPLLPDGLRDYNATLTRGFVSEVEQQFTRRMAALSEMGVSRKPDVVLNEIVDQMLLSRDVVPNPDGTVRIVDAQAPQGAARFGRQVFNPVTGDVEDTLNTFFEDAAVATEALAEAGLAYEDLGIGNYWDSGSYSVVDENGTELVYAVGTEFRVGDQIHTLGFDENGEMLTLEELSVQFAQITGTLPGETGLGLGINPAMPDVVSVVYTPRFVGSETYRAIEDRLQEWEIPRDVLRGDRKRTEEEREQARQMITSMVNERGLEGTAQALPPSAHQVRQQHVEGQTDSRTALYPQAASALGRQTIARLKALGVVPDDASMLTDLDFNDIVGEMKRLAQLRQQQGGPGALDGHYTDVGDTYGQRRADFIRQSEGMHQYAHSTPSGNVTVGIGFNMDREDGRSVFEEALGVSSEDYDRVYSGQARLSPAQIRTLFDYTVQEAEQAVHNKFHDVPLREHQRLALVSIAFHDPDLIGPEVETAIRAGDWEAVENIIRTGMNPENNRGLENRRIREASMWRGFVE